MRFAFAILESSPASRDTSSGGSLASSVRLVRKLLTSCAVRFVNAGSAKSGIAKRGNGSRLVARRGIEIAIANTSSLHPSYGFRRDHADFSPRIQCGVRIQIASAFAMQNGAPMWTPLDCGGVRSPYQISVYRLAIIWRCWCPSKTCAIGSREKKEALSAVNQLARGRCGSNSQVRSAFPERHALPAARA